MAGDGKVCNFLYRQEQEAKGVRKSGTFSGAERRDLMDPGKVDEFFSSSRPAKLPVSSAAEFRVGSGMWNASLSEPSAPTPVRGTPPAGLTVSGSSRPRSPSVAAISRPVLPVRAVDAGTPVDVVTRPAALPPKATPSSRVSPPVFECSRVTKSVPLGARKDGARVPLPAPSPPPAVGDVRRMPTAPGSRSGGAGVAVPRPAGDRARPSLSTRRDFTRPGCGSGKGIPAGTCRPPGDRAWCASALKETAAAAQEVVLRSKENAAGRRSAQVLSQHGAKRKRLAEIGERAGCASALKKTAAPAWDVVVRTEENVAGTRAQVLSQHGAKRKHLADIYPLSKRRELAAKDQVRYSGGERVVFTPVLRSGPPDLSCLRQSLKSSKDRKFWVKQTLKYFDLYRRYLVQKGSSGRLDLEVRNFMQHHGLTLNREKRNGAVPGVEVGQQFYYRWELEVVGLHFSPQSGIDTRLVGQTAVATSIVFSGGYEDDVDRGDEIEFTGQGGNDYSGTKRQQTDQQLTRGNMAMTLAYKRGYAIRVTRGHANEKSPSKTLYVYDGLYKMWKAPEEVTGLSGHKVWKFYLRRMQGQAPLSSEKVNFFRNKKGTVDMRNSQVHPDISQGQEVLKVPVVNEVDDESPPVFKYCSSVLKYPRGLVKGAKTGCKCDHCGDEMCYCLVRNGKEWPYTPDGTLVRAQPIVYECSHVCSCNEKACPNRVTQKGMKFQLEVFKTVNKGWGVRSWDCIPAGSFICEVAGEVIDSEEFERREGQDLYMFRLDFGRGASTRWGTEFERLSVAESWGGERCEESNWFIDANKVGSVARFINHSCSPNVFAQYVLYDHEDLRFPHVMIFASEMIPACTEITLDYGLFSDENEPIVDASGNPRRQACYCESAVCKGRVY